MSEIRNKVDVPSGKSPTRILEGIFPGNFRREDHSLQVSFLIGKTDSKGLKGAFVDRGASEQRRPGADSLNVTPHLPGATVQGKSDSFLSRVSFLHFYKQRQVPGTHRSCLLVSRWFRCLILLSAHSKRWRHPATVTGDSRIL